MDEQYHASPHIHRRSVRLPHGRRNGKQRSPMAARVRIGRNIYRKGQRDFLFWSDIQIGVRGLQPRLQRICRVFSFHRCMSLFVLGADIEALQMHREIGTGAVPELEGAFDLVAGRGRDLDPCGIDCHRQRGCKGGRYN